MNRFWSILFFCVPILGIVTFLMAMFGIWPLTHAWLPKSFSTAGDTIDQLFNGIHLLSAVILLGTGLAIGWAIWKFDHRNDDRKKSGLLSSQYAAGSHLDDHPGDHLGVPGFLSNEVVVGKQNGPASR